MRKKKLFAFFLCAALALPPLSGCGNEKDDADKTPSVTQGALPDGNENGESQAKGDGASGEDEVLCGENSGEDESLGSNGDSANDDAAGGTGEDGSPAAAIEITHTRDLSNPNASKKAQLIYDYLCSVSGQGIISGVEESPGAASANTEIQYVNRVAGKYPALRGLILSTTILTVLSSAPSSGQTT